MEQGNNRSEPVFIRRRSKLWFRKNLQGSRGVVSALSLKRLVPCFSLLIYLLPVQALSAQPGLKPFLGRWDLSVKTPEKELPSWIEVSEENGNAKIVMVGVTDHATPLARVQVKDGEIDFVSPKGEEGYDENTEFKGKVVGNQLVGTATQPNGTSWPWVGRRAPALKRSGEPTWGKPIHLFDGKDFAGWRFSDPGKSKWKVENGTLVNYGHGSDIITTAKIRGLQVAPGVQLRPSG